MGIDASGISTALKKHWFPARTRPANLKALQSAATRWAEANQLGPLFQIRSTSDDSLEIDIIPVADPVFLTFESDRLVVGFRSSNGGPGYHAAAIDLLDHIANALSVTWSWVASDGSPLDETGYATTRDFAALQTTMAAFLKQLCGSVSVSDDQGYIPSRGLSFCLPMGLGHLPGKLAGPLGFSPLGWVSDVLTMDSDELLEAAAGFLVWWQKGMTTETWARLLRAQLWQNAEWRPARSESDLRVRDQIRHSFAQATVGGAKLPGELEQAYHQYLECQNESGAPAEEGIGYRKYLVWRKVYHSWALSLPGYLALADQGESAAFEHPDLWLGVSSIDVAVEPDVSDQVFWGETFNGPLMRISEHLHCRKEQRVLKDGSFIQSAMVHSRRLERHKLLILTLTSEKEWPFDKFDRWLKTISCPDLARTGGPLPSTLQ